MCCINLAKSMDLWQNIANAVNEFSSSVKCGNSILKPQQLIISEEVNSYMQLIRQLAKEICPNNSSAYGCREFKAPRPFRTP